MKKHKIGSNRNRRKLFNNHQADRSYYGDILKTYIMPKLHYLRITHKVQINDGK